MNRAERFLRRLEMAGAEGICLDEVIRDDAYTMRNACATARQMGYKIRSERCRKHRHASSVRRYFLEGRLSEKRGDSSNPQTDDGVGVPYRAPAPTLFPEPYERRGAAR